MLSESANRVDLVTGGVVPDPLAGHAGCSMDKGHVLIADGRVDVLLDILLPRAIAHLLPALVAPIG